MKAKHLSIGDKVAIVSLSSGVLGESFVKHELDLGLARLKEFGLEPVIMPNAMKGIEFLKNHPEARAEDLKTAFLNKEIKAIICAIGGDDTYKLLPYMFEQEFKNIVAQNPKIFMGFSDSTINHLALNTIGLDTFYGPALLTDFAEFDAEMLPYTKYWVLNLFLDRPTALDGSGVWYKERTDFSPSAVGTKREQFLEENGFINLCLGGKAKGSLYGGCLDSIYSIFSPNADQKPIFDKHKIFNPPKNAMLFLETSDNKPNPEQFRTMILVLKQNGVFEDVSGVLFGKPQDQVYMQEYMQIIKQELADKKVLFNMNFGHAYPRCIVPYGVECSVDFDAKTVQFAQMFE